MSGAAVTATLTETDTAADPLAIFGAGVRLMLDQLDRLDNPSAYTRTRVRTVAYAERGPEVLIERRVNGRVYVCASHGLIESYTFVEAEQ
jgi:hypothetical protein